LAQGLWQLSQVLQRAACLLQQQLWWQQHHWWAGQLQVLQGKQLLQGLVSSPCIFMMTTEQVGKRSRVAGNQT
jgi:hypothetical protein